MKIGIVLGFGLFNPAQKDYKSYLDFVAHHITEQNLNTVTICGGFTDPKKPEVSEAATIKRYLLSINSGFTNYLLEERSITTNQNIAFATKEIGLEDEVFIYSDLIRLAKVAWMAMHFILGKSQEEIADVFLTYSRKGRFIEIEQPFRIERVTITSFHFPHRKLEEVVSQFGASIVDVLALYNEHIDKHDTEARKEFFKL